MKELVDSVISDDRYFYDFGKYESVRASLKRNKNVIAFHEHGAGSQKVKDASRTISSIAKNALSFPYQCRIMFRLIEHMGYQNILELGTSLGLSSLYLAGSSKNIKLLTLEGDPGSHDVANHIFQQLKMDNIHSELGLFSETLGNSLRKMKSVDLAFIDGHHDRDATLAYFSEILPYCSDHSAIVVDDIYWSSGMQEAWAQIKKHDKVVLSIDLFFCGIVFFKNGNEDHLRIRPDKLLFHL